MSLVLKIHIVDQNGNKMMQFDSTTTVTDACNIIRDKITDANLHQPKDYSLFLPGSEETSGVWLESGKSLSYYLLRNHDVVEYRRKVRQLKVRMLDGTVKTLLVDDSQPVSQIMGVICAKIGIMNHEEYSLVADSEEEEIENKPATTTFGTLTLKRRKEGDKDKDRDAKMEELRKKIRTDDEFNWVDHSKTLREQGIEETDILELRKKYFFSDQNIDSRDPIQLNLLYVQCRDTILDSTHPITQERACRFAGIQCQIQFGDYIETKHKPGFLDLKEFLPQCYMKNKGIEKKIFIEHRAYIGTTEINAKAMYVDQARSLKTFGVTFYLVKEKMKGKNRLVPRLLGITKDSVLRLDEKTKEILKTWPLTTVKRWAASPNTFTLDFGDYSDQYYSVQTSEGEQISQLLAGYIDIIMKRQRKADHVGIEGDDGLAVVETMVTPSKANIIQTSGSQFTKLQQDSMASSGVMMPGMSAGAQSTGVATKAGSKQVRIDERHDLVHQRPTAEQPNVVTILSKPQKALLATIEAGRLVVCDSIENLDTKADIPELGSDPASMKWKEVTLDSKRQIVSSQVAAMNAATAEITSLTSPPYGEVDHTAIGTAVHTITSNLPEMSNGVRMIAALSDGDEDANRILGATKHLCQSYSDLIDAADPQNRNPRDGLLHAASHVGEASSALLQTMDGELEHETQDILTGKVEAVVNNAATLILKAKEAVAQCYDQEHQNSIMNDASACALATAHLSACTRIVAPTISNPVCQAQVTEAGKEVGRTVENVIQQCQNALQDGDILDDANAAAEEVKKNLADLLEFIKTAGQVKGRKCVHDDALETILGSSEKLYASQGNAVEMLRQAKILAQAASDLVQSIRYEADSQSDEELKKRLMAGAEQLAEATAKMIEAAKQCAMNPNDERSQAVLKEAAENVRIVANAASGNALNKIIIKSLENAAKLAVATGIQCMAAAQGAGPYNSSSSSQDELLSDSKAVGDSIPQVVAGVKRTISDEDSPSAQLSLINACNQYLEPGTKVLSSVKAALPTVTDQASAIQLNNSAKQFGQALVDLKSAIGKAQKACSSLEIDSAIDSIRSFNDDLNDLKTAADMGTIRPLPGENEDNAPQQLVNSSKLVGSNLAQLLTSALQGNQNFTGLASRDTSLALKDYNSAVRGVVATSHDEDLRNRLIDAAREVMLRSSELIEEAKVVSHGSLNPTSRDKLIELAKDVSKAQGKGVNCLPGQKDIDDAITDIEYSTNDLYDGKLPSTSKQYGDLQDELKAAIAELNNVISEVGTSARTSGKHLATTSKKVPLAFGTLMKVGMEIAGSTKGNEGKEKMVQGLKDISIDLPKLLLHAKGVSIDPNSANSKNNFNNAARHIMDTLNNLINVCTTAAPGQKECDSAISAIQSVKPLLDEASEQVTDQSYFECLSAVMDNSKVLGEAMTGIVSHAKNQDHDSFGNAVKTVSDAICGLVQSAAQAVYLVGIADPTSVIGRPGLVDQSQFASASESLAEACETLKNPTSNGQLVLNAATVIAKHTSSLCNSCQVASAKTNNPAAKRQFVQSAKTVANATANLVKEIKALTQDFNDDEKRARCKDATNPLLEAVENLCTFVNSPEFASVPAKISSKARESQVPITNAGKSIVDGACSMIELAKALAVNPNDTPIWQAMAGETKNVTGNVKTLVLTIRDKAPGQKECDDTINKLNLNIRDLDQASLSILDQNLQQQSENTLQGFNEQVENAGHALLGNIDKIRTAAKSKAEMLGHSVVQLSNYFDPLVAAAIGSASNMPNSKKQRGLLDQAKTVAEGALHLVQASKESAGNGKAVGAHHDVDDAADAMKEALQDLLSIVESIATEAGVVSGLVESITTAMNKTEDSARAKAAADGENFVEYQTRMVKAAKEIARLAQDMIGKANTDATQMGNLGASVSHQYGFLSAESFGAIRQTPNNDVADVAMRLRSSIHELGQACIDLVKSGGAVQAAPGDTFNQKELAESARHVGEKASHVLAALQAGSRGTQACINAISTIGGITGDLDTTIMFASAGTLTAESEGEKFSDHRENILKAVLDLDDNSKALVSGVTSSQEKLASAAQKASSNITQLAEVVKNGASTLGSNHPQEQMMLINAVKDVANSLSDLLHCTKDASGKREDDPTMVHLKESAKVMEANTASLLKTVEAVEDEQTRGTRALEGTIEAIAKEIKAFNSEELPKTKATPEDLVRSTKPITIAAAKAVGAGKSLKQDDVIVAANMGRKAVSDMLIRCKAVAVTAETPETRAKVLDAGRTAAVQYRTLLQTVLHIVVEPGPDAQNALVTNSQKTADSITSLLSAAESLKGVDFEDSEDPTVIAADELQGAAKSIDLAAKKLEALKPRRQMSTESDSETTNFDGIILESCKSIASSIRTLIEAATAAQRELVEEGKVSRCPSLMSDDGQWSEGLVSAAKFVAGATHCLCEAANSLIQGHSSEEKLISSARQVAASTAQLLVACKVKADPYSKAMKRLQIAGNNVKRSTDRLVKAAKKSTEHEEVFTVVLKTRHVAGIAQEIEAKEHVRQKEIDLAKCRSKLSSILRKKYKDAGEAAANKRESTMVSQDRLVAGMEQEIKAREDILRIEGELVKAKAKLEVIQRERQKHEEETAAAEAAGDAPDYNRRSSAIGGANRNIKVTYTTKT